jgi:hypothetical protein
MLKKLTEIKRLLSEAGKLYYTTNEAVPAGQIMYHPADGNLPRFFVCHPGDIEYITDNLPITHQLIPLRDWQPGPDYNPPWLQPVCRRAGAAASTAL